MIFVLKKERMSGGAPKVDYCTLITFQDDEEREMLDELAQNGYFIVSMDEFMEALCSPMVDGQALIIKGTACRMKLVEDE